MLFRSEAALAYWRAVVPCYARPVAITAGNDRIRSLLLPHPADGLPRLVVDPSCKRLIQEAGELYRFPKDGRADLPVDRDNDAVAALRYGVVDAFGTVAIERSGPQGPTQAWRPPWQAEGRTSEPRLWRPPWQPPVPA